MAEKSLEYVGINFAIALDLAVKCLHNGYHSDADLDRCEKIIGHCSQYFTKVKETEKEEIE